MKMSNIAKTYELLLNFFRSTKSAPEIHDLKERINRYDPEFTTDEIRSYKALYITEITTPWFLGLNRGSYGLQSTFKCKYHSFPDYKCTCGFHSYKIIDAAFYESKLRFGTVVAEIDNYGDIIEHELGYRSEEQVIKKLFIHEECTKLTCKQRVTHLTRHRHLLLPRCLKHTGTERYSLDNINNIELEIFSTRT